MAAETDCDDSNDCASIVKETRSRERTRCPSCLTSRRPDDTPLLRPGRAFPRTRGPTKKAFRGSPWKACFSMNTDALGRFGLRVAIERTAGGARRWRGEGPPCRLDVCLDLANHHTDLAHNV